MHFIVHCLDHEDALQRRLVNYEAHREYVANAKVQPVISGLLVSDDGQTMIGSCFLFEAESKEDVVNFNRNDPFSAVGVWRQVSIHGFLMRIDNRDE